MSCLRLWTNRYPATLSARVIDGLLRGELGYDGAICTDCMEMKAIADGWGAGESAVLAVLAGVDLLLYSHRRAKQEAAYDALMQAAASQRISAERVDRSVARIQALKRRHQLQNRPPLEIVASDAHLSLARRAARAGTVLLQSSERWPIVSAGSRVLCIEFATQSDSDLADPDSGTALARYLRQRLPHAECLVVGSECELDSLLADAALNVSASEVLIVATRNAHMLPWQARAAQTVVNLHPEAILLCLRNPYDVDAISGAGAVLCSNGDSAPSLEAAVDAICGDFVPSGKLTVNLESAI